MKKYILTSLALAFCVSSVLAQDKSTKKADKRYDRMEYVKAAKEYKKVLKKKGSSTYVYKQLADTYSHLKDFNNAAEYLGKYLDSAEESEVDAEYYIQYAQLLKSTGKDAESNNYMQKFAAASPNDSRAKAFKKDPNYLSKLQNRDQEFELNKLGINTGAQEFGAYEHDGKLYYVSARNNSRRKFAWTGEPTLDVYVATKKADDWADPKLLKGDINTKFHEGAVVITEDGKTMYFTRNDYTNNKYRKSSEGVGQLKIYQAKLVNGKWADVSELPFTSSEYSTGNIALSPDESMLYFTSDMPGGHGGTDLYRVAINADGSFGEPENLGADINTAGDEDFAYVDSEGTLYFSSNGHLGMGGLDVFKAEAQGNGFGKVVNMGKDVNSRADDFSFAYYPEEKRGYVASNRAGMADNSRISVDNIYAVDQIVIQEIVITTKVTNKETGEAIPGAKVAVYDANENRLEEKIANADGEVVFTLPGGEKRYSLQAEAKDFEPGAKAVPHQLDGEIDVNIQLDPIVEEEIEIEMIHFEYDKYNISKESAYELDKIYDIMKKYTSMRVEITGHTDNIGSVKYNQTLSENRAKAAAQYLVDKGIDESRIDTRGASKLEPKIECTDCTDEERAINRRDEFKLLID